MPKNIPVPEQLKHLDEIVRMLAILRAACYAFDRFDAMLDPIPHGPESDPKIKLLLQKIEREHLRPMWGCIVGHSEWPRDKIEEAIWSCEEDNIDEVLHELRMVRDDIKRGGEGVVDMKAGTESSSDSAGTAGRENKETGKRRQRGGYTPKPLTAIQTETVQRVSECDGDIAKAAKQMGKSYKTVQGAYQAAMKKLGATGIKRLPKAATQQLPHDKRGQVYMSKEEDYRQ